MEYIGIDVHLSESQFSIRTEPGEILERRLRTRPDRFAEVLGDRPRARVLIEASTESEWVARCLEDLGHAVIVADPNYAPMYATRIRTPRSCAPRPRASRCDAADGSPPWRWRAGSPGSSTRCGATAPTPGRSGSRPRRRRRRWRANRTFVPMDGADRSFRRGSPGG